MLEQYSGGFYPARLGKTEITPNYVSVGVFPPDILYSNTTISKGPAQSTSASASASAVPSLKAVTSQRVQGKEAKKSIKRRKRRKKAAKLNPNFRTKYKKKTAIKESKDIKSVSPKTPIAGADPQTKRAVGRPPLSAEAKEAVAQKKRMKKAIEVNQISKEDRENGQFEDVLSKGLGVGDGEGEGADCRWEDCDDDGNGDNDGSDNSSDDADVNINSKCGAEVVSTGSRGEMKGLWEDDRMDTDTATAAAIIDIDTAATGLSDAVVKGFAEHNSGSSATARSAALINHTKHESAALGEDRVDTAAVMSSSSTPIVLKGPDGYRKAISDIIIPQMEKFDPQLLIISGMELFRKNRLD